MAGNAEAGEDLKQTWRLLFHNLGSMKAINEQRLSSPVCSGAFLRVRVRMREKMKGLQPSWVAKIRCVRAVRNQWSTVTLHSKIPSEPMNEYE